MISSAAQILPVAAPGELCIFMACQGLICAIAARWVDRLILADEALTPEGAQLPADRPLDGVDLVASGGKLFAAWDLSALLELPLVASAVALIWLPHEGRELPLALRVGSCLFVEPLVATVKLPPGMFRARRGAVDAAFPAPHAGARTGGATMGFYLDPSRLWSREELDRSSAALDRATSTGPVR